MGWPTFLPYTSVFGVVLSFLTVMIIIDINAFMAAIFMISLVVVDIEIAVYVIVMLHILTNINAIYYDVNHSTDSVKLCNSFYYLHQ